MRNFKYLLFLFICMFTCLISVNAAASVVNLSNTNDSSTKVQAKTIGGGVVGYKGTGSYVMDVFMFGQLSYEYYTSDVDSMSCYFNYDTDGDDTMTETDVRNYLESVVGSLTSDELNEMVKLNNKYAKDNGFSLSNGMINPGFTYLYIKNDSSQLKYYAFDTATDNSGFKESDIENYSIVGSGVALRMLQKLVGILKPTIGSGNYERYAGDFTCIVNLKQKDANNYYLPQLYLHYGLANLVKLNMNGIINNPSTIGTYEDTTIESDRANGKDFDKKYNKVRVTRTEAGKLVITGIMMSDLDKYITTEVPITYSTVYTVKKDIEDAIRAWDLKSMKERLEELQNAKDTLSEDINKLREQLGNYFDKETIDKLFADAGNDVAKIKETLDDKLDALISSTGDNGINELGELRINGVDTGLKVCNLENPANCPKDQGDIVSLCKNEDGNQSLCVNGTPLFEILANQQKQLKWENGCLYLDGDPKFCESSVDVRIENNCIIVGKDKLCVDKNTSSSNDIKFKDNCYYRNGELEVCKGIGDGNNTGTVSNPKTGIGMILYFIVPSALVVGFSIFYKRYRKQKYEM